MSSGFFWYPSANHLADSVPYHRFLMIDYYFVRLYINTLALQAVARRNIRLEPSSTSCRLKSSRDFGYIREVMNSAKQVLEIVTEVASENRLKYIPVRMYIRIASASTYLINVCDRLLFRVTIPATILITSTGPCSWCSQR